MHISEVEKNHDGYANTELSIYMFGNKKYIIDIKKYIIIIFYIYILIYYNIF